MEQREDRHGLGGNGHQVRGADCGEWARVRGRKQAVDGVWGEAVKKACRLDPLYLRRSVDLVFGDSQISKPDRHGQSEIVNWSGFG
jgi:hypothetical protein